MTTPERLRRRQIGESIGIGLLAFGLVAGFLYFRAADTNQRECVRDYIAADYANKKIRSEQVNAESQATRDVILGVFSGQITTEGQFRELGKAYIEALASIDKVRKENPLVDPAQICGIKIDNPEKAAK